MRFLKSQGRLVFPGVNIPKRYESTPHYFKELEIIGSNAFGIETYKKERKHAFTFYLSFLSDKLLDPSDLITHTFDLGNYEQAFSTLTNKNESKAIKVLFRFG
ncbi:MAG: hypothetical protein GF364_01450 [Candidatus Lokiarchaeota archaeon]|nr:hypothetical protein [Candidatus Lokiarchaeota archaeon]